MSNFNTSANMNLPIPIAGVETGPNYALDVNNALTLIDSHDHSSGKGVQINPSGINVNSDLTFNNSNATMLRSIRWNVQPSALSSPTDVGCAYVVGVDLYYNDISGNQVRITQGGSVAGSTGSISGLSSPASASYVSGSSTFVWQSDVLTPANLDAASVIFRNLSASSNGITVTPTAALASNYTLTLPLIPVALSFLTIDTSGNIATSTGVSAAQITSSSIVGSQIASQTLTQGLLAPRTITVGTGTVPLGGVGLLTGQSATWTVTSYAPLTGQTISLVTSGRPVWVGLTTDPAIVTGGGSGTITTNSGSATLNITIFNNTTATYVAEGALSATTGTTIPISSINGIDVSVAGTPGTYNYEILVKTSTSSGTITGAQLVVYEL